MEKREPSYTAGGNVNWYNHYGKQYVGTQKTKLPYDPPIPLLGIYLDKTFIEKDIRTPFFTATLFTVAKTWKQPKCPQKDEWIRKMWFIHIMEYYSATKKNKIMPFTATWMELETPILNEVSKRKRNNL